MLNYINEKAQLKERQFSLKFSNNHVCFIIKEIVHNYKIKNGSAINCFIDLSKAIDDLDHFVLGEKSIKY